MVSVGLCWIRCACTSVSALIRVGELHLWIAPYLTSVGVESTEPLCVCCGLLGC